MPTARDDILANIRRGRATGSFPGQSNVRSQILPASSDWDALADQFARELTALYGKAYRCPTAEDACNRVLALLSHYGARTILAWELAQIPLPGLVEVLQRAGVTTAEQQVPLVDDARTTRLAEIDAINVGLTGALAGFADTGSLLVAAGAGRGRLASLITPVHIAILPIQRLHASMRTWQALEEQSGRGNLVVRQSSNVVTITGPSRSGDIGGQLQLGVHGPKDVHVVLWG